MADNNIIALSTKKWPMKHHEHRPKVKFGLKCLLICKLNQKAGGHMLMTKFHKVGKTKLSSFGSFRTGIRQEPNLKI
jgi:hypothetical protein